MNKKRFQKELFQKYAIYKKVFPKQFKISYFYRLFLILLIFIYALASFINVNNSFDDILNKTENFLDIKYLNYWFCYLILNYFTYTYIYKAYQNIKNNFLNLKIYCIWFILFSLFSISAFLATQWIFYYDFQSLRHDLALILISSIYSVHFLINFAFMIYSFLFNKKQMSNFNKNFILAIFAQISKMIFFIIFIILAWHLFDYVFVKNKNFLDNHLIKYIVFQWKPLNFFQKSLIFIVFLILLTPLFIKVINNGEYQIKKINDQKMGIIVSLAFLCASFIWTIFKFKNELFLNWFNYFFLLICLIVALFLLLVSFRNKSELNSNQVRGMYCSWSLLIVWICFVFIRIIFDFRTEEEIQKLQMSDMNLFIASFTSIFILCLWVYKNSMFSKKETWIIKMMISGILISLTFISLMKLNGIYFFINEEFRIDMLFFSILLFIFIIAVFGYSLKQMIIYKKIKNIRSKNE